jgi:hypothetical protein
VRPRDNENHVVVPGIRARRCTGPSLLTVGLRQYTLIHTLAVQIPSGQNDWIHGIKILTFDDAVLCSLNKVFQQSY